MINWINFFHIYQPPNWPVRIIKKVAREGYRPLLNVLKKNRKIKITLNISGSLTEQLAEYKMTDIIRDIKLLAAKKQIELVGSALYHPILPLIPEREITRQIQLNHTVNKKYFGASFNPNGFFSPEMCYSRRLAAIIEKLGFKWLIADEIAANGRLGKVNFDQTYQIKNSKLKIIFRNRRVSDYFSFHSKTNYPRGFMEEVNKEGRGNQPLITAMDGENLGHHRKGLDKFWQQLVTDKNIRALTVTELLKPHRPKTIINPKKSSWSSREDEIKNGVPYVLWQDPTNPIHKLQWKLVNKLIQLVYTNQKHKNYKIARKLLDKRMASDQFWWAAAKPWWSLRIIKTKTNELCYLASLLQNDNSEYKKIANQIIAIASRWQKEIKYKKIADRYLAAYNEIRYIGGKKITVKK